MVDLTRSPLWPLNPGTPSSPLPPGSPLDPVRPISPGIPALPGRPGVPFSPFNPGKQSLQEPPLSPASSKHNGQVNTQVDWRTYQKVAKLLPEHFYSQGYKYVPRFNTYMIGTLIESNIKVKFKSIIFVPKYESCTFYSLKIKPMVIMFLSTLLDFEAEVWIVNLPLSPGRPGRPSRPLRPGNPEFPLLPLGPGRPGRPLVEFPGIPGSPLNPVSPFRPGNPSRPGTPSPPLSPGIDNPGFPFRPGSPFSPRNPGWPAKPSIPGKPWYKKRKQRLAALLLCNLIAYYWGILWICFKIPSF